MAAAPGQDWQLESEAQRVYANRIHYFKRIGFEAKDARRLADSAADHHAVKKAVASGCSLKTALEIFA